MSGRPKTQGSAVMIAEADPAALAAGGQALTKMGQHSMAVAELYADGVSYDRERVITEARFLMAQSAEAMLEAGKRLIQIKENEPHGDFVSIVTQRLGLGERSARHMMAAAVKYLSPVLAPKAKALSLLGKAKLFDLAFESDDEIAALANGGTLLGYTLDEIDGMTTRELKKALREAREDSAAKDRLLEDKNKRIDKLTADKKFKPSAEALAKTAAEQQVLEELGTKTSAAELDFMALANAVDAAFEADNPALRQRAQQAVQYLVGRMALVIDEHRIDVDLSQALDMRPDWLKAQDEPEAKAGRGKAKKA